MPELSKTMRAALCGAFCVIVLTAMLVRHAWPLMTGETIYLEVIARDPRDLFRGDYVVLTYPIDQLTVRPDGAPPAENAGSGVVVKPLGAWRDEVKKEMDGQDYYYEAGGRWRDKTLYVQLEPQPSQDAGVPQVHRPVTMSDEPIAGSVNLKGRLRSLYRNYSIDPNMAGDPNQRLTPGDLQLTLHYGIDALFVQEGTGLQIEEAIRAGKVHAVVMVTSSGDARLRDLVIDGKTWSSIMAGE